MDRTEDDIRQSIRETHTAMIEKLKILEERVQETIVGAKSTVEDIVGNVKGSVDDTVEKVRDTVDDTFEKVKRTFDFGYQVSQHPWLMFGGAVLAGYMLGCMGRSESRGFRGDTDGANGAEAQFTAEAYHTYPQASHPLELRQEGMWGNLRRQLRDETEVLLSTTITGLTELLRGTLREALPQLGPFLEQRIGGATASKHERSSQPSEATNPATAGRAESPRRTYHTEPAGDQNGWVPE